MHIKINKSILVTTLISSSFLLCGYLAGKKRNKINKKNKQQYAGYLRIDDSEKDENPMIFLELHTDVKNLLKQKNVELKVIHGSYVDTH